jgi:hypothetical protein
MPKRKKLAILIPTVLDVGVLLILPTVIGEYGLVRGIVLCAVAMAAPWVPFMIISRAIGHEISKEKQDWEAEQERDFV